MMLQCSNGVTTNRYRWKWVKEASNLNELTNTEMSSHWNGNGGRKWVNFQDKTHKSEGGVKCCKNIVVVFV